MTPRMRRAGWAAPAVVWALLGITHKMANVQPGLLPSAEAAALVAILGVGGWLAVGVLIYAAALKMGRGPRDAGFFMAAWGLTQLPLGGEAVGALLMLDPGWPQVLGYALAVLSLQFVFPVGVVVFLTRAAGVAPHWSIAAGLLGWYLWLVLVWIPLVR